MKKIVTFGIMGLMLAITALAGQDVLLPSAARTTTTATSTIYSNGRKCAHFVVNITAASGTLTPSVLGQDALGTSYTILTGTGLTGTGTTVLKVCPGITASANAAVADMLPDTYTVSTAITGTAATFTYSVTQNTAN